MYIIHFLILPVLRCAESQLGGARFITRHHAMTRYHKLRQGKATTRIALMGNKYIYIYVHIYIYIYIYIYINIYISTIYIYT